MIRQRFTVFAGIGPKLERTIWDAGISDWRQFLRTSQIPGLSVSRHSELCRQVRQWATALDKCDLRFFVENLASAEHWQLYRVFGDSVRYLDIETTGLSACHDLVTMVGIHDGKDYQALVQGKDLTASALQGALKGCKLLITYFGKGFDIPFLKTAYPTLEWHMPHYDLCYAARRLGLTGGLKNVEIALGMKRSGDIEDIDGFEAVRLWHAYQRGDKRALNLLIEYNQADTENLARIAPIVYQGLCKKCRE